MERNTMLRELHLQGNNLSLLAGITLAYGVESAKNSALWYLRLGGNTHIRAETRRKVCTSLRENRLAWKRAWQTEYKRARRRHREQQRPADHSTPTAPKAGASTMEAKEKEEGGREQQRETVASAGDPVTPTDLTETDRPDVSSEASKPRTRVSRSSSLKQSKFQSHRIGLFSSSPLVYITQFDVPFPLQRLDHEVSTGDRAYVFAAFG